MLTDAVRITDFIAANRITAVSARTDRNPNMANAEHMDHWKVTLTRPIVLRSGEYSAANGSKARLTVTFSKGIGHKRAEPTAAEVLDCLASDAVSIDNAVNFEDWCSETGYDSDSRTAERTYKACSHLASRLRRFLGEHLYQQLLWNTERE